MAVRVETDAVILERWARRGLDELAIVVGC
jgi:hypothetical protein